jgi:hypothetical protein
VRPGVHQFGWDPAASAQDGLLHQVVESGLRRTQRGVRRPHLLDEWTKLVQQRVGLILREAVSEGLVHDSMSRRPADQPQLQPPPS